MPAYRIRLRLQSPLATPLHSGTLFGHLCWAKRLHDGEKALTDWLATLPESPLLLSDALPRDQIPRPLLQAGERPESAAGESRRAFLERLQQEKTLRKTTFISLVDFLALRAGMNETNVLARLRQQAAERSIPAHHSRQRQSVRPAVLKVRQAHNTIDRLTGTTPETGGLYFMDEEWRRDTAAELDVYATGDLAKADLEALFCIVGEFGFGRDANLGRGRFTVAVELADSHLFAHDGNRLLSLSHGVLSDNMIAPFYKLHTHYGKLGGLYAGGERSPFKYPLLLTRPGATFSPADAGPFGALLAGVHPHHAEIRQNAWHLCLPFTAA
jgi:CRISPR-associated protein Csm4